MRHWPWQHKYEAISAQHVIADYWGDGSKLKEGIGTRETVVLLSCPCGKLKTKRLLGHWDKETLERKFEVRP